jgi:hypothetical protein
LSPSLAGDIPTITVYPAPEGKAIGAAMVICPGGVYGFLATEHEGKEAAEWLDSLGVAGCRWRTCLAFAMALCKSRCRSGCSYSRGGPTGSELHNLAPRVVVPGLGGNA